MKLGIISTIGGTYSWAGSEEPWRLLATQALAQGHAVVLNAPAAIAASTQVQRLCAAGLKVCARPNLNRLTRRLASRGIYSRFREFFEHEPDIVFLSLGGVADCVWMPDLLRAVRKTKVPMVIFVQANAEGLVDGETQRVILRSFYERARLVIFLSHHNHRLAERQLAWKFPHFEIVMNPLREAVTAPLPWPENLNDEVRFAEVARLEVADKQQDHLLEALAGDTWKERNWKLTFFGSGPDEAHIRRLIDFYGLGSKVEIAGFVNDFGEIWRNQHLHVLPSRREGMPLALIESMACGRPALVTRAGGSPELVEDGVSGFVCPGMHPEILSETLERAWQQRGEWQKMGMAARAKIETAVSPYWPADMLKRLLASARK